MRGRAVRRSVLVTAVGVGLSAVAPAVAQAPPEYGVLVVKHGKQSVQGTLGTNCQPTPEAGQQCAEATYPLKTTGRVTLTRGREVQLLLKAPAGYVRWRAARVSRGEEVLVKFGEAKVATKTKKRWKFTVPKDLRKSTTILGFDVVYPSAYASFEVGAKVR